MFETPEEVVEKSLAVLAKKDAYTAEHSRRVGELMEEFAVAVGLPKSQARQMRVSGILHDAGKLDLPDKLLGKIARGESLGGDDKVAVKRHVEPGRLLEAVGELPTAVIQAIRHHHERWDGSGYPDGLAGGDIPPAARMLAICDLFDAVTRDRPVRPGMKPRKAARFLRDNAGKELDPKLVEIFINKCVFKEGKSSAKSKFKTMVSHLHGYFRGKRKH